MAAPDQKYCLLCDEPVSDKIPGCPLQCRSSKCKAYAKKVIIDSSVTPIFWIVGGPGSGKGTQCEKIIAKYGFTHLSIGELLKEEMNKKSNRSRCLATANKKGFSWLEILTLFAGQLMPNDIVLQLVKEAMEKNADTSQGFLIDGFPREKSQGAAFEKAIAPVSLMLFFEASAKTLNNRLLSTGQSDDSQETNKMRLKTFNENNEIVLEQYSHKLKRIDADRPADAIFKEVQMIIDTYLNEMRADMSKKPIVWILGGPGSGKGTQCDKIIAKYGFTHLSTGDLLRAEVKSGSNRGKSLSAIMERGELVPNELMLELLKDAMIARNLSSKGFLIDGYPREKSQGIAFESTIAPVTVIIYFEASSKTLTKRLLGRALSSGRADDNEETIKLRLKTFLDNNDQVLAQYPQKLRKINAEQTVDKIFREVEKILDPLILIA